MSTSIIRPITTGPLWGPPYTFTAAVGQLGIATPVSNYDTYTVTDSFEGTLLLSKSGSHRTKDSIDIYEPKSDVTYYVTYADSTQRICSLYQSECLNVKDKYTVFFGGNHPKVEMSTTANKRACAAAVLRTPTQTPLSSF